VWCAAYTARERLLVDAGRADVAVSSGRARLDRVEGANVVEAVVEVSAATGSAVVAGTPNLLLIFVSSESDRLREAAADGGARVAEPWSFLGSPSEVAKLSARRRDFFVDLAAALADDGGSFGFVSIRAGSDDG
jgi:hypothetical protein